MSVRVGDEVVTTPTMASENDGWRLSPEDMVIHDLDGGVARRRPRRASPARPASTCASTAPTRTCGSVFHLHLSEALAAVERWAPGVVSDDVEPFGVPLVRIEDGLDAQTEPHDSRVEQLLGLVPRGEGAVSISPGTASSASGRTSRPTCGAWSCCASAWSTHPRRCGHAWPPASRAARHPMSDILVTIFGRLFERDLATLESCASACASRRRRAHPGRAGGARRAAGRGRPPGRPRPDRGLHVALLAAFPGYTAAVSGIARHLRDLQERGWRCPTPRA